MLHLPVVLFHQFPANDAKDLLNAFAIFSANFVRTIPLQDESAIARAPNKHGSDTYDALITPEP